MELMEDRMADMERRRVSLDDVKKMFKQRMQRDIAQTEADLANKKSSNIFDDPLIQQIRQNQENQESAVDKIRRKREERRRKEREEKEKEEEKKREMKSEDPNERRARARAEREKIAQGKFYDY